MMLTTPIIHWSHKEEGLFGRQCTEANEPSAFDIWVTRDARATENIHLKFHSWLDVAFVNAAVVFSR